MPSQTSKLNSFRLLVTILASVIVIPALANETFHFQQAFKHPYFAISAGTATTSHAGQSQYFPMVDAASDEFYQYSLLHRTQTNLLTGLSIGIRQQFDNKFEIQAGLDYAHQSSFLVKGSLLQGADLPSADAYQYQYRITTNQLLISGKLLYSVAPHVKPYLYAAMGGATNDAFNYTVNYPRFMTFSRMYTNHCQTSFSYTVGAGLDIDITTTIRLGIAYHFTDPGKVALGTANIDGIPVAGTLFQSHFYINNVLAQLTLFS